MVTNFGKHDAYPEAPSYGIRLESVQMSVYYSVTAHVVDINQTVRPCASDHAPDLTGP